MVDYISRKEWGAAKPKGSLTPNNLGRQSILFVHWSAGQGRDIDTVDEVKATMRSIQALHQKDNGWADIGYSYVVFQAQGRMKKPRLCEARGFKWVPAAQAGHNTGNGAVCVVMAPGEKLKDSTVELLEKVYRHFPGVRVMGHRAVTSTECPGDALFAKLPQIAKAGKAKGQLP